MCTYPGSTVLRPACGPSSGLAAATGSKGINANLPVVVPQAHAQNDVMIISAQFPGFGPGPLVRIEGNLNADRYLHILRTELLP